MIYAIDPAASRHLVDEDLLPLIDQMAEQPASLDEGRRRLLEMMPPEPQPEGINRVERIIPGPGRDLRVLVYSPLDSTGHRPALLYVHGGGYMFGAPELGDRRNIALARKGYVVVASSYSLAPESRYPAALEDLHAALVWMHANAAELGLDPARIGLLGESAGGGHAAGLALLARDRRMVELACQWLIFPMIDDRTGVSGEPHPYAGAFVWTPEMNRTGWTALLGQEPGAPPPGAYAVPARAENLAGLPPTVIQVGTLDLFIDECLDFARRLVRAGVPVELHVYPGAVHGFTLMTQSRSALVAERDGFAALDRIMRLKPDSDRSNG